jgi:hypothetical protein
MLGRSASGITLTDPVDDIVTEADALAESSLMTHKIISYKSQRNRFSSAHPEITLP